MTIQWKTARGSRSAWRWLCSFSVFVFMCAAAPARAGTLVLAWDANSESDVTGYLVSWGTASGNYVETLDVGNQTTFAFVEPDTTREYYFSVRAYDSTGLISAYAVEVKSQPPAPALPPVIASVSVSSVSLTGAQLSGSAIPQGAPTIAYFEFGPTPSYGRATTASNLGWGVHAVPIDGGTLADLTCGTTYYFRAIASNALGNVAGATQSFATAPCRPQRRVAASVAATDFDGNGASELAIFRPWNGSWWIPGRPALSWGLAGDVPVSGDYDGDGATDLAVFRPATGTWWVRDQSTTQWGTSGDVPVPADYDGDGTTDLAVFRPSTGTWWVRGQFTIQWGHQGDIPVPGDYDGDGRIDLAVFRPSTGAWWVRNQFSVAWGAGGDIPVPGDYDGDGRTDLAIYRPSTGAWWIRNYAPVQWGVTGDVPAPADYDGDGVTDVMIYRPGNGTWWKLGQAPVQWGSNGDVTIVGPR